MNLGNVTLWIAAGLGMLVLLSLAWATLLRRQVQRRTRELEEARARRQQAEQALDNSERCLRSLVETLPHNIACKDLQGRFSLVNEMFCRTVGRPMKEILGKADSDLFPAELATRFRRDDEAVLAKGKLLEKVEEARNAAGQKMHFRVFKNPLYDSAGQRSGLLVIYWDVTAHKEAEERLETTHKRLLDASRLAGMTQVATSVLHNVGNVLNSVNVSVSLISDHLRGSNLPNMARATALLREHETDLGLFLTQDARGRQLPAYLEKLAEHLTRERKELATEVESLRKNIEHMKDIVAMQQNYVTAAGLLEPVRITELVEDALRIHTGGLARHEVRVTREFAPQLPVLTLDKHKVLQILVNLLHNAKYACQESGRSDRQVTISANRENDSLKVSVRDNGIGIAPENLARIFHLGFTTRKNGHGYGLHSCALAAQDLGGRLLAHSDGPGLGATFTLELPISKSGSAPTITGTTPAPLTVTSTAFLHANGNEAVCPAS